MLNHIPEYARPIYGEENRVMPINKDCGLPLWSGKGEPPAIGSTVPLGGPNDMTVKVEGYAIQAGWLMIIGVRSDGKRGDLAGMEIHWPALLKESGQ